MENLFITKIVPHGTSLGIIIPIELLRGLELQRGDSLVLTPLANGMFQCAHLTNEKIKELKTYINKIPDIQINER